MFEDVKSFSHFILPGFWRECVDRQECLKVLHLEGSPEYLQNVPQEWLDVFLAEYVIAQHDITRVDSEGRQHSDNGPAYEYVGCYKWFQHGELHREGGPALTDYDKSVWYQNGLKHRVDGPAEEHNDGGKAWFLRGELHRVNGPAVEHSNGDKEWWFYGDRHRFGGPAITNSDGSEEWYVNGKLHRLDGPAVTYVDGRTEHWVQGGKLYAFKAPFRRRIAAVFTK